MSDNKRENVVTVPSFSYQADEYTTVKMQRWHYHIDRGKLWLIEGSYTKDKLEEIIRKCERADSGVFTEQECPKHFSIVGRPIDLVKLAKEILNFYHGYENIHY